MRLPAAGCLRHRCWRPRASTTLRLSPTPLSSWAGDEAGPATRIGALAWIAAAQRHPGRAAILLGAAAAAREASPAGLPAPLGPHHEAAYATAGKLLGQEGFAAELAKGRALSPSR